MWYVFLHILSHSVVARKNADIQSVFLAFGFGSIVCFSAHYHRNTFCDPIFEKILEQTEEKQEVSTSMLYINPTEHSITETYRFIFLIIKSLYVLVVFLMLFQFLRNLLKIFNKIKTHPKQTYQGAYLVILEEECAPHSFWNYIFINKKDAYEENVLLHELTHIRQRHSLDLLFVELLKIVFWFHPVVHLFGKAIRINHEFLADACVVSKHTNIAEYQMLILKRAASANTPFYNYFNFYNTKKRLIMLQTKVNHFRNLCKVALLIPTSVLFLVVFAEKSYAQEVQKEKEISPSQPSTKYKMIRVEGVRLANGKGEKTTVTLTDEAGNEIVEQISNNEDRQAFTKKYGVQLPSPPPPPPSAIRVKKAEELPPPPAPPAPVSKAKKSTELPPPPPVPVKEK